MEQLYVESLPAWKSWLEEHRETSPGVWLIFYKKESGVATLTYEDAIEEALCHGWIDSIIKKRDEVSHLRKFTPRKDDSNWSDLNKSRVEKMIREQRMTAYGAAKIETAKQNGRWNQTNAPRIQFEMPDEFQLALDNNPTARQFFDSLTKTDRKQFIIWIASAKRPETREKRIRESLELLEKGQKLGLR